MILPWDEFIRCTLLYSKMAVIPLVPKTKMADVGKLISLGNLLVRKVTWFVLTTTSATMNLSSVFGADCMTRIADIYSRLPKIHSLQLKSKRQHTLFHIFTSIDSTLSLSLTFWLPAVNPTKMYIFYNLFLSCSAFSVRLLLASNRAEEISSNSKRDKQPTWEKTHSS